MKVKSFRKMVTLMLCGVMLLPGTKVLAADQQAGGEDYEVKIGEYTIDTEALADEYGVDVEELKEAIEEGVEEEKASPFSSLDASKIKKEKSKSRIRLQAHEGEGSKIYRSNQDSTAYVANAGAKTASGVTPQVGMCAMYPKVTTRKGSTTNTMIKFGTPIYMTNSVNVNGKWCSYFTVTDRGNPCGRTNYWIDIYFGQKTDATYKAAVNYGIRKVSYYYYR